MFSQKRLNVDMLMFMYEYCHNFLEIKFIFTFLTYVNETPMPCARPLSNNFKNKKNYEHFKNNMGTRPHTQRIDF